MADDKATRIPKLPVPDDEPVKGTSLEPEKAYPPEAKNTGATYKEPEVFVYESS